MACRHGGSGTRCTFAAVLALRVRCARARWTVAKQNTMKRPGTRASALRHGETPDASGHESQSVSAAQTKPTILLGLTCARRPWALAPLMSLVTLGRPSAIPIPTLSTPSAAAASARPQDPTPRSRDARPSAAPPNAASRHSRSTAAPPAAAALRPQLPARRRRFVDGLFHPVPHPKPVAGRVPLCRREAWLSGQGISPDHGVGGPGGGAHGGGRGEAAADR